MWKIDDEKISMVAKAFMKETEIHNAYVMQSNDSIDWVQLFDNRNPNASVILKVSKSLFKYVREYSPTEWNPYPEVKPPADGRYLVKRQMKIDNGDTAIFIQLAGFENGQWFMKNDVIAFRELPQPYDPKYERKPWEDDDSDPEWRVTNE